MAAKKRSSAKRQTKSKKHAKKSVSKRASFLDEVDTGLIVLLGLVAASTFVAFMPLMFKV